jgi:hypothetical protein
MRHRFPCFAVLAALSFALPVRAALLPFQGEVVVFFPALSLPVVVPGAGVAELNGPGAPLGGPLTTLALPAGAFSVASDFPGAGLVGGLRVTAANGAGSFSGLGAGAGGGPMPILGTARLCLLLGCDDATAFVDLPLSVAGAGGTSVVTGAVSLSLRGAPWTLATVTISVPGAISIVGGRVEGPLGLPGTAAQPGGMVELVTPILLSTSLPGFEDLDGWALLSVRFVPEPATALLLATGAVLLALHGRRQRQPRESSSKSRSPSPSTRRADRRRAPSAAPSAPANPPPTAPDRG